MKWLTVFALATCLFGPTALLSAAEPSVGAGDRVMPGYRFARVEDSVALAHAARMPIATTSRAPEPPYGSAVSVVLSPSVAGGVVQTIYQVPPPQAPKPTAQTPARPSAAAVPHTSASSAARSAAEWSGQPYYETHWRSWEQRK